jgi:hypothetical protein
MNKKPLMTTPVNPKLRFGEEERGGVKEKVVGWLVIVVVLILGLDA